LLEDYTNGYDAGEPHLLASGTKAFNGLLALAGAEDGLLSRWAKEPERPIARAER